MFTFVSAKCGDSALKTCILSNCSLPGMGSSLGYLAHKNFVIPLIFKYSISGGEEGSERKLANQASHGK